jgi:choline kinase
VTASRLHVVVLAAGRGSRLTRLGQDTPKWLMEVGGRTIADRQVQGIREAGDRVASARVITGHGAPAIDAYLAGVEGVEAVFNPQYAALNNWYSMLLAMRELPADGHGIAILNSDLLAEPSWVGRFLRDAAGGDADGLLAIDFERRLTDESMKVQLRADRTLERIGKVDIADPAGEYVGMLMARGAAFTAVREALEAFEGRPEAANEWYEGAVGRTAAAGTPWHAWAMPGTAWVEIDDDDDLDAAVALVGS